MLASAVIDGAVELLQDADNVRWPRPTLLSWLNDGQLQIVVVRPDAKTLTADLPLVAGPLQRIPSTGLRLLDVVRNKSGRGITLVTRQELNDLDINFYTAAGKTSIKHFAFDERFPKEFHCYPPAAVGAIVEGRWSVVPVACASESASIDLDDTYKPALIDYICHRAFLKNSESPTNQARAIAFLESFMFGRTGKTASDKGSKPRRAPE